MQTNNKSVFDDLYDELDNVNQVEQYEDETIEDNDDSSMQKMWNVTLNGIFYILDLVSGLFKNLKNPFNIFLLFFIIAILLRYFCIDSLPTKDAAKNIPLLNVINNAFQNYAKKYIAAVPIASVIYFKRLVQDCITPLMEVIWTFDKTTSSEKLTIIKSKWKELIKDAGKLGTTEIVTIGSAKLYGFLFGKKGGILSIYGFDLSGHFFLNTLNVLLFDESRDMLESSIKVFGMIGMIVSVFYTAIYFHTIPESISGILAGLTIYPIFNTCFYLVTLLFKKMFPNHKSIDEIKNKLSVSCKEDEHIRTWAEFIINREERKCVPNDTEPCVPSLRTRTWTEWKAGKPYCKDIENDKGKKHRRYSKNKNHKNAKHVKNAMNRRSNKRMHKSKKI